MLPVVDGAPALGPHREDQAALDAVALGVAIPERGAEVAARHRAEILFETRWPHGGDRSLDAHVTVERRRLALSAQRIAARRGERAALLRILSGDQPDADRRVEVVPDRHGQRSLPGPLDAHDADMNAGKKSLAFAAGHRDRHAPILTVSLLGKAWLRVYADGRIEDTATLRPETLWAPTTVPGRPRRPSTYRLHRAARWCASSGRLA